MDPLSLGASIVGLISLADLVVTKGTKFYCSVKNAPKETSTLIGEAMALMGVLSTLKTIVDQQNNVQMPNAARDGSDESTEPIKHLIHGDADSLPPIANKNSESATNNTEPVLISSCREALQEMLDILVQLENHPEEMLKNAAKRLRWPFMENTIKELSAKIERHKSSFQLAISADNL